MISISSLFEAPNVPSEQANGLTVPFGNYNPAKRNNEVLGNLQGLNKLPLEDQVKKLRDSGVDIGTFI